MKVPLKMLIGFNFVLVTTWIFLLVTVTSTNDNSMAMEIIDQIQAPLEESDSQKAVHSVSSSIKGLDDEWANDVCTVKPDHICHHVHILKKQKVTFCSAAKVASTTTKQYFFDIADGTVKLTEGARYGVHTANWTKIGSLNKNAIKYVLRSKEWTHVFFWKHVLERFVSGYLDKVVNICSKHDTIEPHMVLHHYQPYGFSCEKHTDLEAFVSFMETVPTKEGHFASQTPLCNLEKFPYTDIIRVDENLSSKLHELSQKLGVEHPAKNEKTSSHKTGAKEKMITLFKGKEYLIERILNIFNEDCINIPEACDVKDLMVALTEEQMQ